MRFNHRNNRFDHQKSLSPPVDVKNPKTRGRMGHTVTTLTPFDKCIWCIWIVSGCSFALRLKKNIACWKIHLHMCVHDFPNKTSVYGGYSNAMFDFWLPKGKLSSAPGLFCSACFQMCLQFWFCIISSGTTIFKRMSSFSIA